MKFTGIPLSFFTLFIIFTGGINSYAQGSMSPGIQAPRNNISTAGPKVKTQNGVVEGNYEKGADLETYKGVPYAQPPLGLLRWKEPKPLRNWKGIRLTKNFGPRAMQKPIFSDMRFRSNGVSEDCLYLNIWKPAAPSAALLPVLVYFYGGGFIGGDGSEYRYDGADMARKGIITITVNYRLGIFGFFAHPELSSESAHHVSGNYGLLDQNAALRWVNKNIRAFGGDPKRVTIAGESAGSISVFSQLASPLSKDLFAGAIGESGALINPTFIPASLDSAQLAGLAFMKKAGYASLKEMRAASAEKLLDQQFSLDVSLPAVIDGYFFSELPVKTFEEGKQAKVPLLTGWNSAEGGAGSLLGDTLSPAHYAAVMKKLFGPLSAQALRLFPGRSEMEVRQSATDLASDMFIVFGTWKWANLQVNTGKPVYRYLFSRVRQTSEDRKRPVAIGASHSSEIEYALGNLPGNKVYDWNADDYKVSSIMEGYFSNFIKTGNPNAAGLPEWTPLIPASPNNYLNIDVNTSMKMDGNADRFEFLNHFYKQHN